MDFTSIQLYGLSATSVVANVDLPIAGLTPSNPYILKAADGLGPPDDLSVLRPTREIVLRVGLNPDYSSSQNPSYLRDTLYRLITRSDAKRMVLVYFTNNDFPVAYAEGKIKKFETVQFSKDPEVQITIECPDGYLVGGAETQLSTVDMSKTNPTIANVGTAPCGFYMEVTFTSDLGGWVLYGDSDQTTKMWFNEAFTTGDKLMFNTQEGERSIYIVQGGVTYNAMRTLSPDSEWITLEPGENTLQTSTSLFDWGTVKYRKRYWGV